VSSRRRPDSPCEILGLGPWAIGLGPLAPAPLGNQCFGGVPSTNRSAFPHLRKKGLEGHPKCDLRHPKRI